MELMAFSLRFTIKGRAGSALIRAAAHFHVRAHFSMTNTLYKLLLVTVSILLFFTPAYADVSQVGYYFALALVPGVLFLPAFIVALSRRTRRRLYLAALILWAVTAFAYLWFTRGSQNEFFLISSFSYILLVVYLFKEKKLDKARNDT